MNPPEAPAAPPAVRVEPQPEAGAAPTPNTGAAR